jgi:lysophospholipase L1-like esterase
MTKYYFRTSQTNGIGAEYFDMLETAGSTAFQAEVSTTAGGTEIQWTDSGGGGIVQFVSPAAEAGGFTLTSTDINLRALEDTPAANCGGRYRVFKRTAAGVETELGGGPFDDGVEFTTSEANYIWIGNVTDTAFAEGDRILVKVYITNVGTMGGGRLCGMIVEAADGVTSWFNTTEAPVGSVGEAAGTGTATGSGASTAASPGAASGTGTATGVGASTAASTGAATGTGTASGVGASMAASTGAAAGAAAISGLGASTAAAVGSAAGVGTVAGAGEATAASEGAAAGTATVSGVSASTATLPPHSSDLAYFIDVQQSDITKTGDLIDAIADLSGVGVATTSTGTLRPTHKTAAGGGIRFSGAQEMLVDTAWSMNRQASALFIVSRTNRLGSTTNALTYMPQSGGTNRLAAYYTGQMFSGFDSAQRNSALEHGHGIETHFMSLGAAGSRLGIGAEEMTTVAFGAGTVTGGKIGRWDGTSFPLSGEIIAIFAYNRELSQAECNEVRDWCETQYQAVARDEATCLIFDGDSLTFGTQSSDELTFSYPAQLSRMGAHYPKIWNDGTGGAKIQDNVLATNVKTQLTNFAAYTNRVVMFWFGTNDISSGRTEAQIEADIDSFISAVRAHDAGAIIIATTIIAREPFNPTQDALIVTINDHIKVTADFDRVVDLAADARLSDGTDTTYYDADGIHLNDTGYGVVADLVRADLVTAGYLTEDGQTGVAVGTATVTGVGAAIFAGVGASAGLASVSGVGASTAAAVGASAGTATVTATGESTAAATGASSGTGAATGAGNAIFSGVGAASGAGAATGIGASTAASTGAATGTGTASGVGAGTAASTGAAAGAATVSGAGASTAETIGSAAGAATVTGIAESEGSVGVAAGQGTAQAVGASIAAATGASAGQASVSGLGASTAAAVGSAAGVAAVAGVGEATAAADGAASGTATVSGVGASTAAAVGAAAGNATVEATGSATAASTGSAAGTATVAGVAAWIAAAVGSSSGLAIVVGDMAATAEGTGSAAGTATVSGVGEQVAQDQGAGSAAGTATVSGVGASIHAAVGSSAGLAAAAAIGALAFEPAPALRGRLFLRTGSDGRRASIWRGIR